MAEKKIITRLKAKEPEPEIKMDLPQVSDGVVLNVKQSDANLDPKLIDTSDSVVLGQEPDKPTLPSDLSDVSDSAVLRREPDKPTLPVDLSDVGDSVVLRRELDKPTLPVDLSETSDAVIIGTEPVKPALPSELSDVEDSLSFGTPIISPKLPSELSDVEDLVVLRREPDKPALPSELSQVSDSIILSVEPEKPSLPSELPQTGDAVTLRPQIEPPILPSELPTMEDVSTVNVPKQSPPLPSELPQTDDAFILRSEIEKPIIPLDLPEVSDVLRQRIKEEISLPVELPQTADDSQDLRKEYSFDGAWLPDGSPINIGAKNYETLKNFRYKDDGIEGVDGFTQVQANIVASGKRLKGGIQLKTNYTQASYILAQGESSDGTGKVIYQNMAIVPAAETDFTSLHAYADTTAAAIRSRFSMLPGGQVGICGGGKNLIWAGEEMEVAALLVTKKIATQDANTLSTAMTNGYTDYTEIINNSLSDTLNKIPSLGGATYSSGSCTVTSGTNGYAKYEPSPSAGFVAAGCKAGDWVTISGFATNAGNNGIFRISHPTSTPVTADYIYVRNPSAVTETDASVSVIGTQQMFLVGSARPINTIKCTVAVASTKATSTLAVYYRKGNTWSADCLTADNTIAGGITLGQTGTITFTGESAEPVFIEDRYLYFYLFVPSANGCNAEISQITVGSPIQNIVDIWDGFLRTAISCVVYRPNSADGSTVVKAKFEDFTLEIIEKSYFSSNSSSASGAHIGGMQGGTAKDDHIVVIFSERIAALYFGMIDNYINKVAANMTIYTWNKVWTEVTGLIDNTKSSVYSTASVSQSGFVTWDSVPFEDEYEYNYRGIKGYAYKIKWSADPLTYEGTEQTARKTVIIDELKGVTAQRNMDKVYSFPWMYRNRAMWCDCISDSERSRIDYSSKYSPDVYNGEDSSGKDNAQSLYFGSKDKLTGAVELFKEFSDGTDSVGVVTKTSETYLLSGDNPETFQIRTISHSIGCPAPLTMDVAEMAIGSPNAVKQNVAIWMSDKGPVIFNGSVIQSLVDFNIKKYFTPGNALCIHDEYINIAAGIYDPNFNEYHLSIPSGTSATTNNVWLVYDLGRGKWRENVPTYDFPQAFIRVEDTLGNKYIYAVNDNGFMVRLDNGRVWSTTTYPITHTVKTGAGLYSDSLWNETMVNRLKVVFDTNKEGYLEVNHYLNGNSTRTTTVGDNTMGLPPSTAPRPMRYGGVEVITNGTFETTTGWTDVGSTATLSSAADGAHGNCLQILNTGSAAAVVRQAITTVGNQLYRFTCFNKNGTGAKGKYRIGTTPGGEELKALTTFGTTTVWTINTFTFTSPGTTIYLDFVSDTATINHFFYVDDVSIRAATSADDSVYSFRNLIMQCAKTVSSVYYGIIGLSHAFEFIITACSVTKPKLLGWGVQYSIPREDIVDKDG